MNEFIEVEIIKDKCVGIHECGKCVRVCPVSIFEASGGQLFVVGQNQDECILCDICLQECAPGAINILRLYER